MPPLPVAQGALCAPNGEHSALLFPGTRASLGARGERAHRLTAPAVSPPRCAARITLHFDSRETGISTYMDLGRRRRHLSTVREKSQCSATPSRKPPRTPTERAAGRGKQQPSPRTPRLSANTTNPSKLLLCQTSWTIFLIRELMLWRSALCCPVRFLFIFWKTEVTVWNHCKL